MNYISTRGIDKEKVSSAYAIKTGLAADGGLYMPESIPALAGGELAKLMTMSYNERAAHIIGKFLTDYTYEELLKLNAWRTRGEVFRGMRVPTMEDFFRICSNTGMQPTFSVHPPLSRDEWLYVRKLLIKYRLLEHFRVKSHQQETLQLCREIFDDEIAGYIITLLSFNSMRYSKKSVDRSRRTFLAGALGLELP